MNRKLNPEEKKACEKQIERMKEEITQNDYYNEYYTLLLNKGLIIEYEKKRKEALRLQRETTQKNNHLQQQINILTEQINNGVPTKQPRRKRKR